MRMYIGKTFKAKEDVFYNFVKDTNIIPIYQRDYTWKAVDCESILSELKTLTEEEGTDIKPVPSCHLLSIYWYAKKRNGKNTRFIADGQQRLTTINLLIYAYNDFVISKKVNVDTITPFAVKYESDRMQTAWTKFSQNRDGMTKLFKPVYLRCLEFVEEIADAPNPEEELAKLATVIKSKIVYTSIECKNADDAVNFFIFANSKGKVLTKTDTIYTMIEEGAKKYGISISFADKNKKDGKKFLESALYTYMKQESKTGERVSKSKEVIVDYIENNVIDSEASFSQFAKFFKKVEKCADDNIFKTISLFNRVIIKDIYTVLFADGKKLDGKDKVYLEKVILPLCVIATVLTAKGTNPSGTIDGFFQKILGLVINKKSASEINRIINEEVAANPALGISSDDFIKESATDRCRNMLKGLYELLLDLSNASSTINPDVATVEHAYPQKPSDEWSANRHWCFTSEDKANYYKNHIGNLGIMNNKWNSKEGCLYATKKKDIYEQAMKDDAALRVDFNLIDFSRMADEGPDYIEERGKNTVKKLQEKTGTNILR